MQSQSEWSETDIPGLMARHSNCLMHSRPVRDPALKTKVDDTQRTTTCVLWPLPTHIGMMVHTQTHKYACICM